MPESPEVLHLTKIIQSKIKNKDLESVKNLKGRYITYGMYHKYRNKKLFLGKHIIII